MSKITFRADDDLVERVEALDASKSEVMREALRAYLGGGGAAVADLDLLDELVADRVDRVLEDRRDEGSDARDLNVNVTVEHDGAEVARGSRHASAQSNRVPADGRERAARETGGQGSARRRVPGAGAGDGDRSCAQCGEGLSGGHVYCPNCGEKASRRLFCECGDELRSDWAYCPGCGRPTPSAEVLDG